MDEDDEKQSDVITVYSPAGTPVQIIRSSFKNQYEGFGYTLVKPKLTPPSQSAIDNATKNINSNPSCLLEMQKKMDDHLVSVLAPTNKLADEKKAAEDVLKLKKYIHENVEDAAPAFDEAAFKDSIKDAGDLYRHERETPEDVWSFSKRFARKMCQTKDINNPGRMFTMADVPGDHDAAVLARYAHCLPNSSERRYGAIHMAVDFSIMTTNFGAATAPLLTMRFVPAEGDGHCGFRAAVIATNLKRCLREGRTPLNHDGYVSSAQFEYERDAMIALRRDEFNTINEILRDEQAPDKQFIVDALIGNALLPNAESDAVAMMREFREQCANHVKKEVSSIVFTVAAPLRGVSITVWAPYMKDTSLHRIGKHDEYASGLVVFQNGLPRCYSSGDEAKKGWRSDVPYSTFPRAHVIQFHNHFDVLVEAPDMMDFVQSPSLPTSWVPGILHPLDDTVNNNMFMQPFAVLSMTKIAFDYINSENVKNGIPRMEKIKGQNHLQHVMQGDIIAYQPDDGGHARFGVVMMIVLKRHDDSKLQRDILKTMTPHIASRVQSLKKSIVARTPDDVLKGRRPVTVDDIYGMVAKATDRTLRNVVTVSMLVYPLEYIVVPDKKDTSAAVWKLPAATAAHNVIVTVPIADLLQVLKYSVEKPPYSIPNVTNARSMLKLLDTKEIDAHMVFAMKALLSPKTNSSRSTFYSTPARIAKMDALMTELGQSELKNLTPAQHMQGYGRAIHAMSEEGYELADYQDMRMLMLSRRLQSFRPPDFCSMLGTYLHTSYTRSSSFVPFTLREKAELLELYGHPKVILAQSEQQPTETHELVTDIWTQAVIRNGDKRMPTSHTTLKRALETKKAIDWSMMSSDEQSSDLKHDVNPYEYKHFDSDALVLAARAPHTASGGRREGGASKTSTPKKVSAPASGTDNNSAAAQERKRDSSADAAAGGVAHAGEDVDEEGDDAGEKGDDDDEDVDDDDARTSLRKRSTRKRGRPAAKVKEPKTKRQKTATAKSDDDVGSAATLDPQGLLNEGDLRMVATLRSCSSRNDGDATNAFNIASKLQNGVYPELAWLLAQAYITMGDRLIGLYFGSPYAVAHSLSGKGGVFFPFLQQLTKVDAASKQQNARVKFMVALMSKFDPALYEVRLREGRLERGTLSAMCLNAMVNDNEYCSRLFF